MGVQISSTCAVPGDSQALIPFSFYEAGKVLFNSSRDRCLSSKIPLAAMKKRIYNVGRKGSRKEDATLIIVLS